MEGIKMNIWIEGAPGTGKTALTAALGEALGVVPLTHATHEELWISQDHNVIDQHIAISDIVRRRAMPGKFGEPILVPEWKLKARNDDLYIFLSFNYLIHKAEGYSPRELELIDLNLIRVFSKVIPLVRIGIDGGGIFVHDRTENLTRAREIRIREHNLLGDKEKQLDIKVSEILKIIRDMESKKLAPAYVRPDGLKVRYMPMPASAYETQKKEKES